MMSSAYTIQPMYCYAVLILWQGQGSLYMTDAILTRMWANGQRDGRPAEYRWRPLFNAAKFG